MAEEFFSTWKTYQAAWSPMSAADRQNLLSRSVADNCVYTDPTDVSCGHAALTAKIEASQERFPGVSFQCTMFAEHHAQAISNWTMFDAFGTAIFTGTSYARFGGDDGLLTHMTGFFQPVPTAS